MAQKLIMQSSNFTIYSVNLQGNPLKCNCALQWMLNDLVPQLYTTQPRLLDDLRYILSKIIIRIKFNILN